MSEPKKDYWTSLEDRRSPATGSPEEFPVMPVGETEVDRRSFLKWTGFALGATSLAGCTRGREREVMPLLEGQEGIVPGRASWYATVCGACPAGCGMQARVLDGRPVKLEGLAEHPLSAGGLCATGQASLLGVYDSLRLFAPVAAGASSAWESVDGEVRAALDRIAVAGGRVRFLIDSTAGPAERAAIETFLARFEDGRLVTYDPLSLSAIADAHELTHGVRAIPRYRLDRADLLISVGADFLGGWLSPVEHTKAYRKGRELEADQAAFSYHVQLESRLSLSGSNADRRLALPPGSGALVLAHLAERLARDAGKAVPWSSLPEAPLDSAELEELARRLLGARPGRALVLCGDNDLSAQRLTNFLNELLGAYAPEGPLDLTAGSRQRLGEDTALLALRDEIAASAVDALFLRGVNPVYDLPFGAELEAALPAVDLLVNFAERIDETSRLADFVCPEPHALERWGDAEPVAGVVALRQPVLRRMGRTRPLLESLAAWSPEIGKVADERELLRSFWSQQVYPRAQGELTFEGFWNRTLEAGFAEVAVPQATPAFLRESAIEAPTPAPDHGELRAEVYAGPLFDGRHAHNPWLLELPDPLTKVTWENVAMLGAATAAELGVSDGDEVEVTAEGVAPLRLPALVQPGQHPGGVAIALGWGRLGTDRFEKVGPQWLEGRPTLEPGETLGTNAAPLLATVGGRIAANARPVSVRRKGSHRALACTQSHHSLFVPEGLASPGHERRPIVHELALADLRSESHGGEEGGHEAHPSLYSEHPESAYHWGMAIDLTACTGCSACVVSCQAENNVPVVGRDEVARSREMHWLRIDRYYAGDAEDVEVVHMPMMCQHCDLAPCENVCPVQATAQSAEGLNQQVYNRCVGTRYCANNCPYKVRRFNWFEYAREDRLQNLVLNPDVTVRSRGVMEKCSLCVQRIQDAKAEAKRRGEVVADGSIAPACAQSCPGDAIVFGNLADPESRVSRLRASARSYRVLEELGVEPGIGYLALVRNRQQERGNDESA